MSVATPSVADSAADRRRAPRRQPALGTVLHVEPDGNGVSQRLGLVWNISLGGISLLFSEALAAGTVLRGELAADRAVPLPVTMRVTHVSKLRTGDYALGCQFDRPLAPDEMRPFVADSASPS